MPEARMHPEVKAALDAVQKPEVQELIRQVSAHGLAVALPHMHAEGGGFIPLPMDRMAHESALQMSFPMKSESVSEFTQPVAWRWDGAIRAVASCADCDTYVC